MDNLDSFRKQIAHGRAMLRTLTRAHEVIDQKSAAARELIKANAYFLPPSERDAELAMLDIFRTPTTIADAVRLALYVGRARQRRMTPMEIKQCAEEHGFDFSEYNNPLATIHTTLKNMRDSVPPEVTFDEAEKSYLLVAKLPKEMVKTMAERLIEINKDSAFQEIDRALDIMIEETTKRLKMVTESESILAHNLAKEKEKKK